MEIIRSVHQFITHLSMSSIVCLIFSAIAWLAALTIARYVNKNPHQYRGLCDQLIAILLPLGVLTLYLATWSLPPVVAISAVVFYLGGFFGLSKVPSPFSGKE